MLKKLSIPLFTLVFVSVTALVTYMLIKGFEKNPEPQESVPTSDQKQFKALVTDKIVDAIWEPLNDSLINDIIGGKIRGMLYVSSVAEIVLAEIKRQNNVPVSVSVQNNDGIPIGKFAWDLLNDYQFMTTLNSELINRFQKNPGKVSGEKIVELAKFFLLVSRNREEVVYDAWRRRPENPMVNFILRKWGKFSGGINYEDFTINEDIYSFAFIWIAVGGGTIPTEWNQDIPNIAFGRIVYSSSSDIPTPNPSNYGIVLKTPLPTQTPQPEDGTPVQSQEATPTSTLSVDQGSEFSLDSAHYTTLFIFAEFP